MECQRAGSPKAGSGKAATKRCSHARKLRIGSLTGLRPNSRNEIVRWRKTLTDQGLDAGAATIHYHLAQSRNVVPSVATIWRVLQRRGFVTPQPHKRPKSSWIRFEAKLPNQCWQADITHWTLSDGTGVEIANFIDDYSRVLIASQVLAVATAKTVVGVFRRGPPKPTTTKDQAKPGPSAMP